MAEQQQLPSYHRHHSAQGKRIVPTLFNVFLGVEVHSLDVGNKAEWNRHGGDDGEHLHDFIHAITDLGLVKIAQVRAGLLVVLQYFDDRCRAGLAILRITLIWLLISHL